jgi:hypothetical protein
MTPQYGNGWTNQAFAGCANSLNGQPGGSDDGQFARLENNSLGPTSSTRDWSIEFVGDWRTVAQGGTFTRGSPALVFSFYEDTGRSYRHVARLADGAVFADTLKLVDTDTATGPGVWPALEVGTGYGTTTCTANKITNTNLSGAITVAANCGTTTIANVNFTGAARPVITIGTGSTVTASALCVPAGATITGSGTLTYDGAAKTLPYTISPTSGCNTATIADPAPQPPTGGVVN